MKQMMNSNEDKGYYDKAGEHLKRLLKGKAQDDWLNLIKPCKTGVKLIVPVRRANGKIAIAEAYRAQHSYHLTPCIGGVRIAPEVKAEQIEALAIITTIKAQCHDVPFGGAYGGIRIDPQAFNDAEIKSILSRYVLDLSRKGLVGPGVDVLMAGLGCGEKEISWMHQACMHVYGPKDMSYISSVLGKSLIQGGIALYSEASGLGIAVGLRHLLTSNEFCNRYSIPIGTRNKSVIIQGYGTMGQATHKHLQELGCKIVGVIERNSGVISSSGLDSRELRQHWTLAKSFQGFPNAEVLNSHDAPYILQRDCDVLVPAAVDSVIHKMNVGDIKARMIVEAADGPVTAEAQEVLDSRNVPVVPDVLINAGTMIVAYFEWLKGLRHGQFGWLSRCSERRAKLEICRELPQHPGFCGLSVPSEMGLVHIALEELQTQSCRQSLRYSLKHRTNLRTATYALALVQILATYSLSLAFFH